MEDVKGYVKYFRFVPTEASPGVVCSPLMGETESGQVYPVTDPVTAGVLSSHDDWVEVSQSDYDAQTKADKGASK